MNPDDLLESIGRSMRTLLNEDRPFLVSTNMGDDVPTAFRKDLAAALARSTMRNVVNATPEQRDPASESRCFADEGPRRRTRRRGSRMHTILVDWQMEEDLIRLAGMERSTAVPYELVDADGNPVSIDDALLRMSPYSSEIGRRTLSSPLIGIRQQDAMRRLLAAFVTSSCTVLQNEAIIVTAPSPCGPATIRRSSSDSSRHGEILDIDPAIEGILPVWMTIQMLEGMTEREPDTVRIDCAQTMLTCPDLPDAMEAARILAAGWQR